ncbi:MAG: 3'-5' exonuclease domain-containing protein 2 [Prevotella sp.]|nr:3'-5' exonuclease domain-containing protein 2 [Prevotella sp.]
MKKIIYNRFAKEWMAELPKVTYDKNIIVIVTPQQTERAVDYLLSMPILGVDTETRPSFTKRQQFKCSLLQVATHHNCFLFRLNYTGMTPSLIRLLEDKTVPKVGLSWHDDIMSLKRLCSFEPGYFIDIQDHMKEIGVEDLSLQKLYANLFNERISKTERLSNWERDVLTDKQKQYAAIDAWACIQLYEELMRLKETGNYELHALEIELEIEKDFKIYEELATQKGKGG